MAQAIIDEQSGELAFRLEKFDNLAQFDHVQRRNYYSLILMKGQSYRLVVDFSEHLLRGDHMICLSPYQPYMLSSEFDCSGFMLNFHPDFFCTYRHQNDIETEGVLFSNFQHPPFFNVIEEEYYLKLIDQISNEMERDSIAQHEVLVAFLKVLLIEAVRQKKKFDTNSIQTSTNSQTELLQRLIDSIEANYSTTHTPQEYADMLCVSPKTMGGIVKKYLDQTTTSLIVNRVVIEAKRELYLTSKSVKEVAALLGYHDEFYFSRLFKKKVGVSPDVYRKTVGFAKLET